MTHFVLTLLSYTKVIVAISSCTETAPSFEWQLIFRQLTFQIFGNAMVYLEVGPVWKECSTSQMSRFYCIGKPRIHHLISLRTYDDTGVASLLLYQTHPSVLTSGTVVYVPRCLLLVLTSMHFVVDVFFIEPPQ